METFETIQPEDIAPLLEKAVEVAHKWETPLGKERKGKAEKAFAALANGHIELGSPQAYTQRLRPKDFEARGLVFSEEIRKSMYGKEGNAFYVVPAPVLLFPGRGAQYRLLEGQFTLRTAKGQPEPVIRNLFPQPIWQPVLNWGGQLGLGLDGELAWGAEVEGAELKIKKLGGELTGRVNNLNRLAGFIQVTSFVHDLGRMEIEAQHSNNRAMWRLDSKKAIRGQKQTRLIMLLQVPKKASQIQIEAAAQAEVSFDWLTAQVNHVFDRLPDAIQQIIQRRKGLPLQDFQTWTLDLPRN